MSALSMWLGLIAMQAILLAVICVIRMRRLESEPRPTLRDQFAIAALPVIACGHSDANASVVWVRPQYYADLAVDAYVFADAMLEASK